MNAFSGASLAPAIEVGEDYEDGDDDPGDFADGDGAVVHFFPLARVGSLPLLAKWWRFAQAWPNLAWR
jgi:hypothetical protein